jgi:hypothetical protein
MQRIRLLGAIRPTSTEVARERHRAVLRDAYRTILMAMDARRREHLEGARRRQRAEDVCITIQSVNDASHRPSARRRTRSIRRPPGRALRAHVETRRASWCCSRRCRSTGGSRSTAPSTPTHGATQSSLMINGSRDSPSSALPSSSGPTGRPCRTTPERSVHRDAGSVERLPRQALSPGRTWPLGGVVV